MIAGDLARALADLRDPRLWGLAAGAAAVTLALLGAVFGLAGWALGVGADLTLNLPWVGDVALGGAAWALWLIAALAASLVLTPPVAALFIGLMLDRVVDAVEARSYSTLPPPRAIPFATQAGAALRLLALTIVANVAGLALWIIFPPAAPFIFIAMNGWLIGREYVELVALRRLDADEAQRLRKRQWLSSSLIGAAVAAGLAVPFLNLLAPLVGVAAATHLFHRVSRR